MSGDLRRFSDDVGTIYGKETCFSRFAIFEQPAKPGTSRDQKDLKDLKDRAPAERGGRTPSSSHGLPACEELIWFQPARGWIVVGDLSTLLQTDENPVPKAAGLAAVHSVR